MVNQKPELVVIDAMIEYLTTFKRAIETELASCIARRGELHKLLTSPQSTPTQVDKNMSQAGARGKRGRPPKKRLSNPKPFEIHPDIPLLPIELSASNKPPA